MNNPLRSRQELLRDLCKKHRVTRLTLFGSAVRNRTDQVTNDFDFLVEFESMPPSKHADSYFGLLMDLQKVLQKPVDLIEPSRIRNPYFKQSIQETQILLYEAA